MAEEYPEASPDSTPLPGYVRVGTFYEPRENRPPVASHVLAYTSARGYTPGMSGCVLYDIKTRYGKQAKRDAIRLRVERENEKLRTAGREEEPGRRGRSGADLSTSNDHDLIGRALRSMPEVVAYRRVRWGHVADAFALGSMAAVRLCRAFGLDPEEEIGPFEWERMEELLYGDGGLDAEEWTRVTGEDPPAEGERYQEPEGGR